MALTLVKIFEFLQKHEAKNPNAQMDDRFDRASAVRVTNLKRGVSKSTGAIRFVVRTQTFEKRALGYVPAKYTTNIDFPAGRSNVKISCSCPDFLYRWEWALWKKGAADIEYGNGEPPTVSNHLYLAGCCKHIVRTSDYLVKHQLLTNQFELPKGK